MSDPRDAIDDGALTPKERALAVHLRALAPQRGPSSELDARILAAARAAVAVPASDQARASSAARMAASAPERSTHARSNRPRRRRWPAITGIAASLVLAVGIAWQLRPVDEVRTTYSEAPSALPAQRVSGPTAADDFSGVEAESASVDGRAMETTTAPIAEEGSQSRPESAAKPAQEAATAPPPADRGADAVAEPEDRPAAAPRMTPPGADAEQAPASTAQKTAAGSLGETPPSAVPAPPPPPAPPAPASSASSPQRSLAMPTPAPFPARDAAAAPVAGNTSTELDKIEVTGSRIEPPPANANALRRTEKRDRSQITPAPAPAAPPASPQDITGGADTADNDRVDGEFGDQPLDDQPPASASSPEVQQAWLKRVRALLGSGDRDAARASLREYQRRYPDAALPPDLRGLLQD